MSNRSGFEFAGESNCGLVRKHNEDAFLIAADPERTTALLAVADGVGGFRHGEVASYMICRELLSTYRATPDDALRTTTGAENFLCQVVTRVNDRIYQRNLLEYSPRPMCSTINAAVLTPEFVSMLNVGDSRFYRWRAGRLEQLSTDHTLSNDPEYHSRYRLRRNSRYSNAISRSVGFQKILNPEQLSFLVQPGDRFMLCTDGIYRDLPPETLGQALQNSPAVHAAVDQLVRQVLMHGALDNLSLLCAFPVRGIAKHLE